MTRGGPVHFAHVGHLIVAALKPRRTENPMTTTDPDHKIDIYEDAYRRINTILNRALGTEGDDSAGEGIAAEVALLAQRYLDLKRYVLAAGCGTGWVQVVAEVEAAELRDTWWEAP